MVSPNLLVNPGFSINQRGGSSYSTANEYTVDRWMLESGSVSTTSGNNGLSLSNASVCQFIEGMEQLSGTVLTLSVFLGGALKKVSGVLSASAVSENGLSFVWTSTGYIKVGITGSGSLEWAKLELGSTATPYSPPDPAAELLKCQRYYYRIVPGERDGVPCGGWRRTGARREYLFSGFAPGIDACDTAAFLFRGTGMERRIKQLCSEHNHHTGIRQHEPAADGDGAGERSHRRGIVYPVGQQLQQRLSCF